MAFCSIFASGICMSQTITAAAVMVDWLEFSPGSGGNFSLSGDDGLPAIGGSIGTMQGFSFPPAAQLLNDSFWQGDTGFSDSFGGNRDISAISFRVAPWLGTASYEITFDVPEDTRLLLMVGDLFKDPLGATEYVGISVSSDQGSHEFIWIGSQSWDNGSSILGEILFWDEVTGRLSPAPAANGNSALGFFEIAPISGENAKIVLSVPQGYTGSATGDTITVALGIVIPEPSSLTLAGLASVLLLRRRRSD